MAPGRAAPASYISSPRRRTSRAASAADERARRHVGAVLAEAVAGGRDVTASSLGPATAQTAARVREDGGLGVLRERELVLRPLPHEPREPDAERRRRRLEDIARGRKPLGQVTAHADLLAPWPGQSSSATAGRTTHRPR